MGNNQFFCLLLIGFLNRVMLHSKYCRGNKHETTARAWIRNLESNMLKSTPPIWVIWIPIKEIGAESRILGSETGIELEASRLRESKSRIHNSLIWNAKFLSQDHLDLSYIGLAKLLIYYLSRNSFILISRFSSRLSIFSTLSCSFSSSGWINRL